MLEPEDRDVAKALLRKFYKHNVWGNKHWREDNLPHGFPPHAKGKVIGVAEELRRMGLLVKRPSSHGYQWYANLERLKEIEDFIRD